MTSTHLHRMAQAAYVIREVIGCVFECEQPGLRAHGRESVMVLIHPPGSALRPYVNYDCWEYQKIEALVAALSEIKLFVEDIDGDCSAVYETNPGGMA